MRIHARCYLDGSCSIWRDKVSSSCTKRSGFETDCTNRSGLEVETQLQKILSYIGLSTIVISHKLSLQLVNLLLSLVFKSSTPGATLEKNFAQASEPASDAGEFGETLPRASLSPAEAWRRSQEPRSPETSIEPTTPEWWSEETKEYFHLKEIKKSNRKPRGFHGISNAGKRMVRCTAILLEKIASGRKMGFGTATLPFTSSDLINKSIEKWAVICKHFNQELVRELERNNLPPYYIFVTEWQKRGALHMHFTYIASNRKGNVSGHQYPIQADWFRATWQRILKNVIGFEFDTKASIDVQPVKKSVAGYLSKYISKGNDSKNNVTQPCTQSDTKFVQVCTELDTFSSNLPSTQPCTQLNTKTCRHATQPCTQPDTETDTCKHPSAWWGASSALKKKVKSLVVNVQIKASDDWVSQALDIFTKLDCYWQQVVTVGSGITMAVTGRMKPVGDYLERFKQAVLGDDVILEKAKIASSVYYEDYWKWRYQRDKCNREFDKIAIEEWIAKKCNASISYGI